MPAAVLHLRDPQRFFPFGDPHRLGLAAIIMMPVGYLLILSLSPEPDVQAGRLIPSRLMVDNFVQAWDVIDLGRGNCMITYVHEAEEDGEPIRVHYWQIANPVPPQHVRVALFSFTVPAGSEPPA